METPHNTPTAAVALKLAPPSLIIQPEEMTVSPALVSISAEHLGVFHYEENYTNAELLKDIEQEKMKEYRFRGKLMKRAPKREYFVPGEIPPTYKWGQQTMNYPGGEEFSGKPMPLWMVSLKDKINSDFNVKVNHAIIIKYTDGMLHHAPPHQDKIPDGTDFFVLSFGTPRKFQLIKSKILQTNKRKKDGSYKVKKEPGDIFWEEYLSSGSLLRVTSKANKEYFHAVPKEKNWKGPPRYSLIFRTISI